MLQPLSLKHNECIGIMKNNPSYFNELVENQEKKWENTQMFVYDHWQYSQNMKKKKKSL